MLDVLIDAADAPAARPLHVVPAAGFESWRDSQPATVQDWLADTGFKPDPGGVAFLPARDADGPGPVLLMTGPAASSEDRAAAPLPWDSAALPHALPVGDYAVTTGLDAVRADALALGWALGAYQFTRYKPAARPPARLVWPAATDRAAVRRAAEATWLARDLINMPAEDMGPAELARAAEDLAAAFRADCRVIVGDDLLSQGWPAVHTVGRASARPPRLIDLRWTGTAVRDHRDAPRLTLVGKGVCFDSGGLDLKPAAGMLTMKKDMGGAACILGLAHMVMDADLPLRLRVLIPAVENAVAGNAFRPLDIIRTRKGLTVEVGNTDAEGRLILCDALHEAATEQPDLLIDMATLTGARLVALGPDLPAMFCNDDATAADLAALGAAIADPVWRLPLHQPYRKDLEGRSADLNSIASHGFAGAIIAALFLEHFIGTVRPWIHIDLNAWNVSSRPGRPEGGEALAMRALFELCRKRFPNPDKP